MYLFLPQTYYRKTNKTVVDNHICLQDESDNDTAVEAKEGKNATRKVPKKVKKQLVYELDDALPGGFKGTTVLVEYVPTQQSEAGNVSYNPLYMVDPSKVEQLTNILKGDNL